MSLRGVLSPRQAAHDPRMFLATGVTGANQQQPRLIAAFGADAIVVALGVDAYEGDPFQGLAATTDDFPRMAGCIAGLGLRTVFVREGDCLQPGLDENLTGLQDG